MSEPWLQEMIVIAHRCTTRDTRTALSRGFPASAIVRRLAGADDLFMIGMEGECERAVGPFAEGECHVELQRIGITPAAADARIARARCAPRIG